MLFSLLNSLTDTICFCFVMRETSLLFLASNNQADVIGAFNSASRYLDDLLNIDNHYLGNLFLAL